MDFTFPTEQSKSQSPSQKDTASDAASQTVLFVLYIIQRKAGLTLIPKQQSQTPL